jgi:CheY-like chemotaxis protein
MIVEDTGPGIAPDFLPHVFERFRQADSSSTRTHKGLGLGLAIVRNLVEMHGGTITASNVTDADRTGAVFTIRLPRQTTVRATGDAGRASQTAVNLDQPPDDAPSLANLHVLVIDDEPDARELVRTILERCGAKVTVAASGADGLRAIAMHMPDVVVTDIEMPEEDGYTFVRRLRELPPEQGGQVPAAALTAYAGAADRIKALAAGFNLHVAKPVQPAELAIVVASLARSGAVSRARPLAQ